MFLNFHISILNEETFSCEIILAKERDVIFPIYFQIKTMVINNVTEPINKSHEYLKERLTLNT